MKQFLVWFRKWVWWPTNMYLIMISKVTNKCRPSILYFYLRLSSSKKRNYWQSIILCIFAVKMHPHSCTFTALEASLWCVLSNSHPNIENAASARHVSKIAFSPPFVFYFAWLSTSHRGSSVKSQLNCRARGVFPFSTRYSRGASRRKNVSLYLCIFTRVAQVETS